MDMSVVHGSVVVGVDGSESSAAAAEWAARYASREWRPLSVVHACGLASATTGLADTRAVERGLLTIGRGLVRLVESDVRRIAPNVSVASLAVLGSPATVLVEASETADLLVTGARGRGAFSRALLGSVSASVVREAHCPVVVVREWAGPGRRPVVVGVDGTPASTAAVAFAFRQAAALGVSLTVLHATWEFRERSSSLLDLTTYEQRINLNEEQERLVAETVASLSEKYPDVPVTEVYRRGDPVGQLVAASRDAALVVVGSRGRRLLTSSLLGSVSRSVAERAECPVAVARP